MARETEKLTGENATSNTSNTSAASESNMRRRRIGRPDALRHIVTFLRPSAHSTSTHIHDVVCYSIWLSLIAYHIGNITPKYFHNSKRYPYFAHRMKPCLSDDVIKTYNDLGDAVYDGQARERIMVLVRPMSMERSMEFLNNCQVSRFYQDAINNQMSFVQDFQTMSNSYYAEKDAKMQSVWRSCLAARHNMVPGRDFSELYNDLLTISQTRLVFLLDILRGLRKSIGSAGQAPNLQRKLLATLKIRLLEFDENSMYSMACSMVGWGSPREKHLVRPGSDEWWTSSPPGDNSPANSRGSVLAYPAGHKMRSTLTFVVPAISLVSVVPAAIAWKHGDSVPGRAVDSNFWQTLSGSIMQLLSLLTFIWPTLSNPRLSQLTWIWIWALAGFSAVCAIVSVPLYLVCPTIWSFVVSFAGVLAQAIVQLQVINAI